jgi:hypothetical protein
MKRFVPPPEIQAGLAYETETAEIWDRRDLHEPDEPTIAGTFVGIARRDFDILLCSQKDKLYFQCRPGPAM